MINLPWLNRIDEEWVAEALGRFPAVVTLDNHYVTLGQGVMVGAALARTGSRAEFRSIGLTDVPACGSNAEVLAHHGLDAASIAQAVTDVYPQQILHWIDDAEVASASRRDVREAFADRRPGRRGGDARIGRRRGPRGRCCGRRRGSMGPRAGAPPRRDPRPRRRAAALERARNSAKSSRPRPASRGRTPSPRCPRRPISACSWKAKAAASTARR